MHDPDQIWLFLIVSFPLLGQISDWNTAACNPKGSRGWVAGGDEEGGLMAASLPP